MRRPHRGAFRPRTSDSTHSTASAYGPRALLTWTTPATAIPVTLLAFVTATLFDLGTGHFADSIATDGLGRVALHFLGPTLVSAGVVGLVTLLGLGVVRRLRRLGRGGRAVASLVLAAPLVAGILVAGRSLLDGPRVASWKWTPIVAPAMGVVVTIAITFVVARVVRAMTRERSQLISSRIVLAAIGVFIVAAGLHVVNALAYPGLYPVVHLAATITTMLLLMLAWTLMFVLLEDRAPTRLGPALLTVALIIAAGLATSWWMRRADDVHAIRTVLRRPPLPFAHQIVPPVERLVIERLFPVERLRSVDVGDLERRLFTRVDLTDELDRRLGTDRRQWNVVIITVDTLRADAVGFARRDDDDTEAPSSKRSITPNLDAFAERSIVFERAYTPYPTSNYAYSSMLTGLYPRKTPARRAIYPKDVELPDDVSLAEQLSDGGWATWAVTAFNRVGAETERYFGHTRAGFDLFNPSQRNDEMPAPQVTDDALELIAGRDSGRPFLLWVHYMEPHAPYRHHSDFDFGATTRDLYRGEVAATDREIGRLLTQLAETDLASRTVIVLLSDHGESFGEHATYFHNSNLYDEQIRVPYVLHVPGLPPRRVADIVNVVDTTPTILETLARRDTVPRHGRSLLALAGGLAAAKDWVEASYSERFDANPTNPTPHQKALVSGNLKLVCFEGDPAVEVYDLTNDPKELHNIVAPNDDNQRRLLGLLGVIDRRIDAGFGGRSMSGGLATEADALLDRFDSDEFSNDFGFVRAAYLFLMPNRQWSNQRGEAIGQDRLTRFARRLEAIYRRNEKAPAVQNIVLLIASRLPTDELRPFMTELLEDPAAPVATQAAFWLANRNDDAGRDTLAASLTARNATWNLDAAVALGRLGDRRALPWAELALRHRRSDILPSAVRSLAAIDYDGLLAHVRDMIGAGLSAWVAPGVDEALARLVANTDGRDADLLLLNWTRSPAPKAQRLAREALRSRYAPHRRRQAESCVEQTRLGDAAFIEGEPERALAHYHAAHEAAGDVVDDPRLALQTARTALLSSRLDEARQALDAMGDRDVPQRWREAARSLRRLLDAKGRLDVDLRPFPVDTTSGDWIGLVPRARTLALRKVTLTPSAEAPRLLGGVWFRAPRLVWQFRRMKPEDTSLEVVDRSRQLIQNFLPPQGLTAGVATEISVLGQLPTRAGRYVPELTLTDNPWPGANDRVLLTLEPLDVRPW